MENRKISGPLQKFAEMWACRMGGETIARRVK